MDDDYEDQEPQNTTVKKTEFKEINIFYNQKIQLMIKCNNKLI